MRGDEAEKKEENCEEAHGWRVSQPAAAVKAQNSGGSKPFSLVPRELVIENPAMTRARALLLLSFVWALIYLPSLGSTEYKGEEPRRVLPAVSMLETGNWIVPMVCGEPFLRKPPLVNWLIAVSFKVSHTQNEWAARAPSVLAVWLLGAGILYLCASWLGMEISLIAALLAITHVGMIDKGRMAEIEAEYIALSGLATIAWLALHRRQKSAWVQWLIPAVLLGISFLAKGPINLIFFYPLVLAVLIAERDWRTLFAPAHLVALAVMFGIFALWAVPYYQQAPADAVAVMTRQSAGRLTSDFNLSNWLLSIPRGLSNFLPWVLLAPLCWQRATVEREGRWFLAVRRATVITFFVILLLPGMLPRYSQPLLIPMCLLIAIALRDTAPGFLEKWRRFLPWCREPKPLALVLASTAVICFGMLIFALVSVLVMHRHEELRPLGKSIDHAADRSEPLYVLDCGYQPFFAYVKTPCIYLQQREDLPPDAHQVLISERELKKLRKAKAPIAVHDKLSLKGKDKLYLVVWP